MIPTPTPDLRLDALRRWLDRHADRLGLVQDSLVPVSGDASFRRYFRLRTADGTLIAMDAPPPPRSWILPPTPTRRKRWPDT